MADKDITLREWINNYKNGKYSTNNELKMYDIACDAGWYDWFCPTKELLDKLKKFYDIVSKITNEYILDNYYVWFKNNCPMDGDLYDDMRFEPFDEEKRDKQYFIIKYNCCWNNGLYAVYTARNKYELEFETNNIEELINYINSLNFSKKYHMSIYDWQQFLNTARIEKNFKTYYDYVMMTLGPDCQMGFIDRAKKISEDDEEAKKLFKDIVERVEFINAFFEKKGYENFKKEHYIEIGKIIGMTTGFDFDSFEIRNVETEEKVFIINVDFPFKKFDTNEDLSSLSNEVKDLLEKINSEIEKITQNYPKENLKFSLFDANNKFIVGHNSVTKFAEMFYSNIKGA
jgi:hypothetical protein